MIISCKQVVFCLTVLGKSSNGEGDVIIQCPVIVVLIARTATFFGIKFSSNRENLVCRLYVDYIHCDIRIFATLFISRNIGHCFSRTRLKLFRYFALRKKCVVKENNFLVEPIRLTEKVDNDLTRGVDF